MNKPDYPVIALWAHPRSMSTVTERIMRERGDYKVFHEPFLAYYYKHVSGRHLALYDENQGKQTDYESVKHSLLQAASSGPVFFKDMSYYVTPRIFEDPVYTQHVHNIFLIRDPRRSIASFHALDPELELTEIGLEAQWQHYSHLAAHSTRTPLVIEAEAIAANPEHTLRRVWEYCGLPFIASAFSWDTERAPKDWGYVQGWHQSASGSSRIKKDDKDATTIFADAARQAPFLLEFLSHHQPFYEKLQAQAQLAELPDAD